MNCVMICCISYVKMNIITLLASYAITCAVYGVVTYIIICTCVILTVEYSSIDWHDFVVVETINFRENETGQ